jgi:hypothetical protein
MRNFILTKYADYIFCTILALITIFLFGCEIAEPREKSLSGEYYGSSVPDLVNNKRNLQLRTELEFVNQTENEFHGFANININFNGWEMNSFTGVIKDNPVSHADIVELTIHVGIFDDDWNGKYYDDLTIYFEGETGYVFKEENGSEVYHDAFIGRIRDNYGLTDGELILIDKLPSGHQGG